MAADSTGLIGKVLKDLNLHLFHDRFRAEEITTYIVCKLSANEFQTLGISNTRDVMRLRNECVKYGTEKPKKVWPQCGPPMYKKCSLKMDAQLLTFQTFSQCQKERFTEEWHSMDLVK